MALDELTLLKWKSKKMQQKEQEEYEIWAFPHGQRQRDNLEALLKAVFPKEPYAMALVSFLTCKELYEKYLNKAGSRSDAVWYLFKRQRNYKQILSKKDLSKHIECVLADADLDESCEYPTADTIIGRAQRLDSLHR